MCGFIGYVSNFEVEKQNLIVPISLQNVEDQINLIIKLKILKLKKIKNFFTIYYSID